MFGVWVTQNPAHFVYCERQIEGTLTGMLLFLATMDIAHNAFGLH